MKWFKNRSSAEKRGGYLKEEKKKTDAVSVAENTVSLVVIEWCKDFIPF